MSYRLREAMRADGLPFQCYDTFDVLEGETIVGLVQCKGPCRGLAVSLNHRHGPWIAFVGPDSKRAKNLSGLYPTTEAAAEAVMAEARP